MSKKDELMYLKQELYRKRQKLRRALKEFERATDKVNDLEEELLKVGES